MASKLEKRKPWYKIKERMLTKVGSFKIKKIVPAQECYINKATLNAFEIGMLTRMFKIESDQVWIVTIFLEEFHKLHTLALLTNAWVRNKWINDELLHVSLLNVFSCTEQ